MTRIPLRNTAASFTRPADTTAYASGDLVANSTTAADVDALEFQVSRSMDGSLVVRRARLKKSDETDVTNASFRLHLYTAAPTVTNGDNAAWLSTHSGYLGFIDITVDKAFSDEAQGEGVPVYNSHGPVGILVKLARDTKLYGLLEARAAYSPASEEVFTVTLEVEPVS